MGQFDQAVETLSVMKPAPLAIVAPVAALALGFGLAACGTGDPAAAPAAQAGTELAITGGRLVLPAVSGNPGAAYLTLTNGTQAPASLAAVTVTGATKAEMHETSGGAMRPITALNLGPGATAAFEPGGKHIMLFGLSKSLKPGDKTKVTLNFSGGKVAAGELMVEPAGGADHQH